MELLAVILGLSLCQGLVFGSSLHFQEENKFDVGLKEVEGFIRLMNDLTSDDVNSAIMGLVAGVTSRLEDDNSTAICEKNQCQVCAEFKNHFGKVCVTLLYHNASNQFSWIFEHTHFEIVRFNFDACTTPEICILGYLCTKITDMYLSEGKWCGTFHINSYPVFKNQCFKL